MKERADKDNKRHKEGRKRSVSSVSRRVSLILPSPQQMSLRELEKNARVATCTSLAVKVGRNEKQLATRTKDRFLQPRIGKIESI